MTQYHQSVTNVMPANVHGSHGNRVMFLCFLFVSSLEIYSTTCQLVVDLKSRLLRLDIETSDTDDGTDWYRINLTLEYY